MTYGQLTLFAALLFGIVTMPTVGHPAEHSGSAAMPAVSTPSATSPSPAAMAERPAPHDTPGADGRRPVEAGERVRLVFGNGTAVWHPLHRHGHTFALGGNAAGARKDTAIVLPHRSPTVDFDADNPGPWMVHRHNAYHAQAGMMTVLGYRN
ncbi:multicopper oxidase domain-containing protein [Streptomyces globisporus]|uniref:multicopper oxidase domain-containing protein n=1 Tax=Streptomyces globisporus TaxID=1908 RepID=UPI0036B775FA